MANTFSGSDVGFCDTGAIIHWDELLTELLPAIQSMTNVVYWTVQWFIVIVSFQPVCL